MQMTWTLACTGTPYSTVRNVDVTGGWHDGVVVAALPALDAAYPGRQRRSFFGNAAFGREHTTREGDSIAFGAVSTTGGGVLFPATGDALRYPHHRPLDDSKEGI